MTNDQESAFRNLVAEHLGIDTHIVTDDAAFIDDLTADSLDTVEIFMAAEELFGIEISDEDADAIETVGQALDLIRGKLA